jgi:putative transposon-encoded protein
MDAHVFLVQKHVVSSLEAKLARIGTAAEIMVPREWALWVLPKEMCR